MRKLAVQFGFTVVAIALSTSVAQAESVATKAAATPAPAVPTSPGGTAAQTHQDPLTVDTSSNNTSVTVTHNSDQHTGTGSQTPPTNGTSTAGTPSNTSNTSNSAVKSTKSTNQTTQTTGSSSPTGVQATITGAGAVFPPASIPRGNDIAPVALPHANVVTIPSTSIWGGAYIGASATTSVPAPSISTGSTHALPTAPQNTPPAPLGLLDSLQLTLNSVLVPLPVLMAQATVPVSLATLAILALGLIMSASYRIVPVSSYTAQLRRAGYLGAPRSDVGGSPFFYFATPLKMSLIGTAPDN